MHPASAETSCGFGAEGGVSGTAKMAALSTAPHADFFRGGTNQFIRQERLKRLRKNAVHTSSIEFGG
jgi:hypothetical protein